MTSRNRSRALMSRNACISGRLIIVILSRPKAGNKCVRICGSQVPRVESFHECSNTGRQVSNTNCWNVGERPGAPAPNALLTAATMLSSSA